MNTFGISFTFAHFNVIFLIELLMDSTLGFGIDLIDRSQRLIM